MSFFLSGHFTIMNLQTPHERILVATMNAGKNSIGLLKYLKSVMISGQQNAK